LRRSNFYDSKKGHVGNKSSYAEDDYSGANRGDYSSDDNYSRDIRQPNNKPRGALESFIFRKNRERRGTDFDDDTCFFIDCREDRVYMRPFEAEEINKGNFDDYLEKIGWIFVKAYKENSTVFNVTEGSELSDLQKEGERIISSCRTFFEPDKFIKKRLKKFKQVDFIFKMSFTGSSIEMVRVSNKEDTCEKLKNFFWEFERNRFAFIDYEAVMKLLDERKKAKDEAERLALEEKARKQKAGGTREFDTASGKKRWDFGNDFGNGYYANNARNWNRGSQYSRGNGRWNYRGGNSSGYYKQRNRNNDWHEQGDRNSSKDIRSMKNLLEETLRKVGDISKN
jgi:hypothetical protein